MKKQTAITLIIFALSASLEGCASIPNPLQAIADGNEGAMEKQVDRSACKARSSDAQVSRTCKKRPLPYLTR